MLSKEEIDGFYRRMGESIKAARINLDISQEELSKYLGFASRISIVNIETGKQKVQLHTLLEIAHYLKIPIQELVPSYESTKKDINAKLLKTLSKEASKEISNDLETLEKLKDFIIKFTSKDLK